jgi:hypothetical protein
LFSSPHALLIELGVAAPGYFLMQHDGAVVPLPAHHQGAVAEAVGPALPEAIPPTRQQRGLGLKEAAKARPSYERQATQRQKAHDF